MAKVPNRLKELRERSRLTQKEVAKILGKDFTTISKHESGDRNPSPEDIKAYANLYKVETYEIFINPQDMEPEAVEQETKTLAQSRILDQD